VPINKAYNEFIKDAYNVHLNATKWPTLTDFVKYLSENDMYEVKKELVNDTEETMLMIIDPNAEKKQAEFERKQNLRDLEKKREQKEIEKQIKKATKMQQ
jgi:DNA/RNA-binding protein KIN17